jgi:acyl carrier protein
LSRAANRARLLEFLDRIRRPEVSIASIRDDDNLVGSGLIDSLAVLEIIAFLEAEFAVDFATTGFDPDRLTTVPSILDIIDAAGR